MRNWSGDAGVPGRREAGGIAVAAVAGIAAYARRAELPEAHLGGPAEVLAEHGPFDLVIMSHVVEHFAYPAS